MLSSSFTHQDSGIELLDSVHYSRPTSHPPSSTHPTSTLPSSQLLPFYPPPSHPSSTFPSFLPKSSIPTPSLTQNPTYSYPNSHPLYRISRTETHRAQVYPHRVVTRVSNSITVRLVEVLLSDPAQDKNSSA